MLTQRRFWLAGSAPRLPFLRAADGVDDDDDMAPALLFPGWSSRRPGADMEKSRSSIRRDRGWLPPDAGKGGGVGQR